MPSMCIDAQNALQFCQQFITIVGALLGGQRLADDLPGGKFQEYFAQQAGVVVKHAGVSDDLPSRIVAFQPSPDPRSPTGGNHQVRQPVAKPCPIPPREESNAAAVTMMPRTRSHFDRQTGKRSFCRRRRQRCKVFSAVDWS